MFVLATKTQHILHEEVQIDVNLLTAVIIILQQRFCQQNKLMHSYIDDSVQDCSNSSVNNGVTAVSNGVTAVLRWVIDMHLFKERKTRTYLTDTVNNMTADDLVTQGSGISAMIELT